MDYSQYFPPTLIDRMTHLHEVLQEVLPTDGLDAWIGGFVGEMRPDNEVRGPDHPIYSSGTLILFGNRIAQPPKPVEDAPTDDEEDSNG